MYIKVTGHGVAGLCVLRCKCKSDSDTLRQMDEVLHANIFFFIASIATVIFCILIGIILYQVIKITKIIRSILEKIEAGSELIAQDVAHVRSLVSNGGMMSRIVTFIIGITGARRRSKDED